MTGVGVGGMSVAVADGRGSSVGGTVVGVSVGGSSGVEVAVGKSVGGTSVGVKVVVRWISAREPAVGALVGEVRSFTGVPAPDRAATEVADGTFVCRIKIGVILAATWSARTKVAVEVGVRPDVSPGETARATEATGVSTAAGANTAGAGYSQNNAARKIRDARNREDFIEYRIRTTPHRWSHGGDQKA
jgi:hypothetical protein